MINLNITKRLIYKLNLLFAYFDKIENLYNNFQIFFFKYLNNILKILVLF